MAQIWFQFFFQFDTMGGGGPRLRLESAPKIRHFQYKIDPLG